MPLAAMLAVGGKLGDYEVVAQLRAGGMATLYLGRRRGAAGFTRPVAIKVVHPHLAGDPQFVRMFVDEGLLSARIAHPNVVHVEELGEADGTYFLVMEYVPGASLSQLLRSLGERGRRMTPAVATWIAMQVAEGLHAAHETRGDDGALLGVVHRDVSPQNVLVSEGGHVKLIDFGIAKASLRGGRTSTGSLRGKIRYMAPEQAHGRPIDRRADLYALGIVLWEMLTTRRLFHADNDLALLDKVRSPVVPPPSRYAGDVPPALDSAVAHVLALDPSLRPQTGLELRRVLADALPDAARIEAAQVAALLEAAVGDEIGRDRARLPPVALEVLAASGTRSLPAGDGQGGADEVLGTLTLSAPQAQYRAEPERDGAQDADASAAAAAPVVPLDAPATPFATTTAPTPLARPAPATGARRDRVLALVSSVIAVAALATAGVALLREQPPARPAAPASPRAAPASVDPTARPVPAAAPAEATLDAALGAPSPAEVAAPAARDADGVVAAPVERAPSTGGRGRARRGRDRGVDEPRPAPPPASLVKGVPIFDDDGL